MPSEDDKKKLGTENEKKAKPASELYSCRARCRNSLGQKIDILSFRVGITGSNPLWTHGPTGVLNPGQKADPTALMHYYNDSNTSVYVKFKNLESGAFFHATAGEFDLEEENDGEVLDVAIEEKLKVFYRDNDVEKRDWVQWNPPENLNEDSGS